MAKNLFVGNLPFTVTDDTLGQLFSGHGTVVTVNVIKDKFSGRSRGFAFVEMSTDEEALAAIEKLNNYNMEGRNIVVKEALPKPAFSNDRGGGGGGRDFRGGRNDRRGSGGFRGKQQRRY